MGFMKCLWDNKDLPNEGWQSEKFVKRFAEGRLTRMAGRVKWGPSGFNRLIWLRGKVLAEKKFWLRKV